MPEFIDKLRVTVRLSRPGEAPVEGVLALLPTSALRAGPETLLDLLDPGEGFLPFERASDDAMLLVARPDIQYVMVPAHVDVDLVRPASFRFTREERVIVRMRGGEELDGVLQMEMPESINRTSDYLNGSGRFFPLTTRSGIFLVQKSAVREILLFSESPLPLGDSAGT
jgi:hypothetical protein